MELLTKEVSELLEFIEEQGLSISEVIEIIKNKDRGDKLQTISLTVDYNQTIEEMIIAGKYDWTNNDIREENFTLSNELKGKITVSARLFSFEKNIGSQNVILKMEEAGYRPATLAELLALGKEKPNLQRNFPIIALGSPWRNSDNNLGIPCLIVYAGERRLSLSWFHNVWHDGCHFLGIKY